MFCYAGMGSRREKNSEGTVQAHQKTSPVVFRKQCTGPTDLCCVHHVFHHLFLNLFHPMFHHVYIMCFIICTSCCACIVLELYVYNTLMKHMAGQGVSVSADGTSCSRGASTSQVLPVHKSYLPREKHQGQCLPTTCGSQIKVQTSSGQGPAAVWQGSATVLHAGAWEVGKIQGS